MEARNYGKLDVSLQGECPLSCGCACVSTEGGRTFSHEATITQPLRWFLVVQVPSNKVLGSRDSFNWMQAGEGGFCTYFE